ncbi:hypothetical protein PanWU01x14_330580 [Parasponia andersonii]|uniref:Retrotransposon Copia-like N-terminal domain-containing protein n=1 Tax=Parasponia andersonii TaxID=3476 RepID=A0A2P5AHZ4_PARAD|nr:hypothetical protein PanWU01x14_330580 [Parasponia andersonii]
MATPSNIQYPYPSTLNIGNFVSLKLTQNNYLMWKTQINGLTESQDMGGFLDRSYLKLKEFISKNTAGNDDSAAREFDINLEYILWRRSDRLIRGWIIGTLSDELFELAIGLETSSEVCTSLADYCAV